MICQVLNPLVSKQLFKNLRVTLIVRTLRQFQQIQLCSWKYRVEETVTWQPTQVSRETLGLRMSLLPKQRQTTGRLLSTVMLREGTQLLSFRKYVNMNTFSQVCQ